MIWNLLVLMNFFTEKIVTSHKFPNIYMHIYVC